MERLIGGLGISGGTVAGIWTLHLMHYNLCRLNEVKTMDLTQMYISEFVGTAV